MSPLQTEQNSIQLIFSGDDYFAQICDAIAAAKSEVLIESYIFDWDPVGIRISKALAAAQKRGVQVKLLVDGVGSFSSVNQLDHFCRQQQIAFRIYHPIPFELKLVPRISLKGLRRLIRTFQKINKRNHRKTVIVDRAQVFLGSFNISQVHSFYYMEDKSWRDTGARVTCKNQNTEIENLVSAFLLSWRTAGYLTSARLSSTLWNRRFRVRNHSPMFRLNIFTYWRFLLLLDLKRRIKLSQKRIHIATAYFLPRRTILRNLQKAAQRGVHVQILLPLKSDVWFVKLASRFLYFRLLSSGIEIFEYQQRMMHAKTILIDDWATLGSHNLNHRSFIHDLEIELVIADSVNLQTLAQQWNEDLRNAKQITLQDLGKLSILDKLLSRILYWFRYWL